MRWLHDGFSIVEFMIAISLGAILVATAGTVYISNKKTFNIQTELARLQENARFAIYHLNKEIRMAGYQGCINDKTVTITNRVTSPSTIVNFDEPVLGYQGGPSSFSPDLPSHLTGKPVTGSDVIEIRKATSTNVQLRQNMNQTNNPILVYDRFNIQAGDILMVSDCRVADIFVAGANSNATAITHTNNNNTSNDLSAAYLAGAHVMRFTYESFYIRNTGRTNADNQPVFALYALDTSGNETELVEGVERMSIVYGVDNNNDLTADQYMNAASVDAANKWGDVISTRINLLLTTTENIVASPQSYQFDGVSYTPTDRRLRREWQTFINLRNRGLPS
tara:strand:- start:300 stop:1307 length:1008 start_codon:yes stop_codon:yes gene_type:complete